MGERLKAEDLTPLEIAMCMIARQRQLLDHSDPVGFSAGLAQSRLEESIKIFGKRFHVPAEPEWFCPKCLGSNVECEAWVDATTNKYISEGYGDNWCADCEEHPSELLDREERERRMRKRVEVAANGGEREEEAT